MSAAHDVKIGDKLWVLRSGISRMIKLTCPSCRGTGCAGDYMIPCSRCAGMSYIVRDSITVEIMSQVRIEDIQVFHHSSQGTTRKFSVLRPPLYLLDAYSNNLQQMCRDYWDDFEKGAAHASAYKSLVDDGNMVFMTYDEAMEQAKLLNNWNIQDICDKEKTTLYDPAETPFDEVDTASADSVTIFKVTKIEEALL